jgi:hypothetical protein
MQGQCYASNPNQNFMLDPKQAEGYHLNPMRGFEVKRVSKKF